MTRFTAAQHRLIYDLVQWDLLSALVNVNDNLTEFTFKITVNGREHTLDIQTDQYPIYHYQSDLEFKCSGSLLDLFSTFRQTIANNQFIFNSLTQIDTCLNVIAADKMQRKIQVDSNVNCIVTFELNNNRPTIKFQGYIYQLTIGNPKYTAIYKERLELNPWFTYFVNIRNINKSTVDNLVDILHIETQAKPGISTNQMCGICYGSSDGTITHCDTCGNIFHGECLVLSITLF
jgi:hypothetical protein